MKLVLTDFDNKASQRLLKNFDQSNIQYRHVTAHYDGFSVDSVLNPFAFHIGAIGQADQHLYFNQVNVPEFYEVRNENGSRAQILQGDNVVGYVIYAAGGKRIVKEVQWLARNGKTTLVERYNRQGQKFADSIFGKDGKESKVIYYKADEIVITYDVPTKSVHLNQTGQTFANLNDFVLDYVKNIVLAENDIDEVIFNNLSTPYFVSRGLAVKSSFYFQELIKNEIPGNMLQIMAGNTKTSRILFENNKQLKRVEFLVKEQNILVKTDLKYLGNIEKFRRENHFRQKMLTITRSDAILHDETIATKFKDYEWTIAAPTNVSDKLKNFGKTHENVTVLEQIRLKEIDDLLENHDYYLDLNQAQEVENVIERAYFEGLVVIGDQKVVKNGNYELVLVKEEEITDLLAREDKDFALRILHTKKGSPATISDYQTAFN